MEQFYSVWWELPDEPGRCKSVAMGGSLDWAKRQVRRLCSRGVNAFFLPFGKKPVCQDCAEFCDELDGVCRNCKPAPQFVRGVA